MNDNTKSTKTTTANRMKLAHGGMIANETNQATELKRKTEKQQISICNGTNNNTTPLSG
jgi:hypothetical protein